MLSVYEMLAATAVEYPQKTAVVWNSGKSSYSELLCISDKIAAYLISVGHKKGDIIGIYASKNFFEVAAIFAILKIGCVFVHINPNFKAHQIQHVILECAIKSLFVSSNKESEIELALGDNNTTERLITFPNAAKRKFSIECIDINSVVLGSFCHKSEEHYSINPDDMACIIYTSGSTGNPKGIMITHRILTDATVISSRALANQFDDRIISLTPFSFDGSLSQLFTSVYVGATLVLQTSLFPNDIVKTLINERITGVHAVPSFWKMMLQKHSKFISNSYPDLRYISVIGEAIDVNDILLLSKILCSTKIYIMYGTTEAFRSTYLDPDDLLQKISSVGKPFNGVSIEIKDENGGNCACGETGEIVHSGVFVSPGYWHDEEKTRSVFKNGAVYTGDLGRLDDDGYLYFAARKDNMIKRLGFRISLEGIENQLNNCPQIAESAVISTRVDGEQLIKAFVIPHESSVDEPAVTEYCKKNLPYYMVPNEFVFVTELPRTSTFKIMRNKLK